MPNVEPLHEGDPAAVGPYRLVGRLGAGGHGVVYLGQARNGTPVAVKALREGIVMGGRLVKDVATARMVQPFCIARVLDASTSGRAYIVSEYVDGPSLEQAGRHTGVDLQRLAVATATALDAIHQAGLIHGDFKPANVLLGPEGPKVVDFGIAAALGSGMKATSTIVGTPAYMAPEQLAGRPVGAPSDVFAWASVIVFATTGVPPFGDDSLPVVINRIVNEEPEIGELPRPLREVVPACLTKDPSARPPIRDVLLHLTAPQRKGRPATQSIPSAQAAASPRGSAPQDAGSSRGSAASQDAASQDAASQDAASPHSGPAPHGGASPQGAPVPVAEGGPQTPAYDAPYQTPVPQPASRPAANDTPDWLWEQTPEPASAEPAPGPGGSTAARQGPGQAYGETSGQAYGEAPGQARPEAAGSPAWQRTDDSAAWQQTADQTLDQDVSTPLGRVVGEPLPRRRTRSPQQGAASGDSGYHQGPGQAAYPSHEAHPGGGPHGPGHEIQDAHPGPAQAGPQAGPQAGHAQGRLAQPAQPVDAQSGLAEAGPGQTGPEQADHGQAGRGQAGRGQAGHGQAGHGQDGSPLQALFDLSQPVESPSAHDARPPFGQDSPPEASAGFGAPPGAQDEGHSRYGGQAPEVPAWSEPPAPFAARQGLDSAPFESQPYASASPHTPEPTHLEPTHPEPTHLESTQSVPAAQSSALVDALVAGGRTAEAAPPPRKRRTAKKVLIASVSGVCVLALGGAIVWLTPTTPTQKATRLAVASNAPTASPSATTTQRQRRSRNAEPQPDESTGTGRATKGRLRLLYVRAGGTRNGDCWAGGEATLQALVERTGGAVRFDYTWYVDGSAVGRAKAGISRNGRRYLAAPRTLTSSGGVHKVTLRITSPLTTQRTVSVTMCPV
ncbi:serine/threonine protein kinase [Nonomuraea mesophila]|uniref:non-specific serine/threonine protein kinase n=1 Tax=Nonomuraea mesophila TaxID=2530382 RepID=A0A4R5FSL2_9ACTN|nr:serine/threonine-protein kinase [Nonomuraea mesophila]TDE55776.1 serine/threonine protein kinase [Nonomuraea mesophila]